MDPSSKKPGSATLASANQLRDNPVSKREHWRFLRYFLTSTALGICAFIAVLLTLAADDRLPAAPLTATNCIDEKLSFLRSQDFHNVTLLAVGSSATWRNLDMVTLEQRLSSGRALNAATCYLHVDQTAFLLGFLLDRAHKVETIVTVLAPRDFERCDPAETAIFDHRLTSLYFNKALPGWAVHALNFRLPYILREAAVIKQLRAADSRTPISSDSRGSSPLTHRVDFAPEPRFDEKCFKALPQLRQLASRNGAELVVATIPTMPEWREKHDRDGSVIQHWTQRIRSALGPSVTVLDGSRLDWPDEKFADAVHLLAPAVPEFSDHLASDLLKRSSWKRADNAF